MNFDDDKKPLFVISATTRNGEPRYIATTTDWAHFNYLKIVRGYEVVGDWNGKLGMLLVPQDEEEEHELRRRELGKMTLADMRNGKGRFFAEIMADLDLRSRVQ